MDFITTGAPPVPIKINGKPYSVPRFLLPEMREWAAKMVQEQMDASVAVLPDAEAKARFLFFFRPPPVDLVHLARMASAPEGTDYILRRQLAKGSVPQNEIEAMLASVEPFQLRALAQQLASAEEAGTQAALDSSDPGATGNPTIGPSPTSVDSRGTTETTSPASPQPTAA